MLYSFIKKENFYGRQAWSFTLVSMICLRSWLIAEGEVGGAAGSTLNKSSYMVLNRMGANTFTHQLELKS